MRIAIIGAGNIGGSTALGLAGCGAVPASDITVTARHESSLEKFKPAGIRTGTDNRAAVEDADVVIYAVKPWQMEDVVKETRPVLDYGRQLIVSMAPVTKPEQLLEWLGKDRGTPSIAYVIPNIAIEIGESMTYISPVTATDGQIALLKGLFDRVGKTAVVPMEQMLYGTSLASSGIAYAMRYLSAAKEGGVGLGLDGAQTDEAVCQTVRGAVNLVEAKGYDSEHEIDRVTTPNGLTIRGLKAMERAGFSEAVVKGLSVIKAPKARRVVVKVGNSVLTRDDGSLDITRVSAIVDQLVALRKADFEPVLVTSGAVACGRSLLFEDRKLTEVQQRQLYSAVGQVRLMDLYYQLFQNYGIAVGQVLTMKKNFEPGQEYENQKGCIEVMLQNHVMPVVNENDTASITGLMFTDNDELSGLVAGMVGAEVLVILTDIEERRNHPSGQGRKAPKSLVAKAVADSGIRAVIADGLRDNILVDVLTCPEKAVFTEFRPAPRTSEVAD